MTTYTPMGLRERTANRAWTVAAQALESALVPVLAWQDAQAAEASKPENKLARWYQNKTELYVLDTAGQWRFGRVVTKVTSNDGHHDLVYIQFGDADREVPEEPLLKVPLNVLIAWQDPANRRAQAAK